MLTFSFVLALIALILALVAEFQSNGRDLAAWGVFFLSLIFLWGRLNG